MVKPDILLKTKLNGVHRDSYLLVGVDTDNSLAFALEYREAAHHDGDKPGMRTIRLSEQQAHLLIEVERLSRR